MMNKGVIRKGEVARVTRPARQMEPMVDHICNDASVETRAAVTELRALFRQAEERQVEKKCIPRVAFDNDPEERQVEVPTASACGAYSQALQKIEAILKPGHKLHRDAIVAVAAHNLLSTSSMVEIEFAERTVDADGVRVARMTADHIATLLLKKVEAEVPRSKNGGFDVVV